MKRNILVGITLCSLVGAIGCKERASQYSPVEGRDYITGTVVEEAGTIVDRQRSIVTSSGARFGNESVRFGEPTYALTMEDDSGKTYTFFVDYTPQKNKGDFLEGLNLAINKGTRIRVKAGFLNRLPRSDAITKVWSDDIYLVK